MAKQPTAPAPATEVPFARQPPLITILSDHATQDRAEHLMGGDAVATLADKDQLDLQARLASTFDILRHKNTRCPLAIAVYGDWGTGKTSAMRWLETRLHEWNTVPAPQRMGHPRAYPVWFDPWRYHSKEEVWRGIIAEVILALFRVGHLDHQNVLPRMVQAVKKFGGFLGRSFIHAVANLKLSTPDVPGLPSLEASGEMFRDIWEEYDKAAHPHKAHLNQFEDTLRTWVTDFLGPQAPSDKKASNVTREPARLVLFIDDLDRCLPEVTLEVIEALKLYLNIDHLVFVVGLDETVVRSVVAKHYKDAGVHEDKAARYLDKVFQVDLRIPPSEAAMPRYMETQITALNDATDGYWHKIMARSGHRETLEKVLIALARNNPREVKRLLNSALLRGRAASLDTTLTEGEATPETEALRFAQGVQVFLLQRLLADRLLQSEDLLTYSHHLRWFATASRRLRDVLTASGFTIGTLKMYLSAVQHTGSSGEVSKVIRPDPGGKEGQQACADLLEHLTHSPPKADPALWTSDLFLRLLQVPFSVAVAAHFPPAPAVKRKSAVRSFKFSSLPDFVRERIALAAGVPVTDLKPEQLAMLRALDLSQTPVTADQLLIFAATFPLEELDLSGCIGLTDSAALAGLKKLKTLSLRNCTGLEGAAALQGLHGLDRLEILSLSSCTGLRSTQGLPPLPALKRLDLSGCTGLEGAEALLGLRGLDRLEELDLGGCTGLRSTQGLPPLPALKLLSLSECTGLEGAEALLGLRGLDRLEILYLGGCTGLDGEALEGLRWQLPASCAIFGSDGERMKKRARSLG